MLLKVCGSEIPPDAVWERGSFSVLENTLSIDANSQVTGRATSRVTVSFFGSSCYQTPGSRNVLASKNILRFAPIAVRAAAVGFDECKLLKEECRLMEGPLMQ